MKTSSLYRSFGLLPLVCGVLIGLGQFAGATDLGRIFQIQAIGQQQLATRPDGTTAIADVSWLWIASHTYLHDALVSQIAFGETNQSAFQGYSPPIGGPLFSPDVAVNATNGLIVFSALHTTVSDEGAYFAVSLFRFDTNGTPTTAVSNVTGNALSRRSDYLPVRADMNRAGRFAVAYFSQTAKYQLPLFEEYIHAQLFNADGSSVAPAFVVNQRLLAGSPVVAVAPDGGAVVAWGDETIGASSYDPGFDIFARRIDANGNPMGNEFRVNTTTNGRRNDAEIAMTTNGSFVIVWAQRSSDADGVYLQRFNADGSRLGAELRVAPSTGTDPQVATSADGRFVVAWHGPHGDGGSIFAQRFLADGSFYGSAVGVNEGATNSQTKPLLGLADDGTFIARWVEGTNHFARWVAWDATNQSPTIMTQPQSVSVGSGTSVMFSVSAIGTTPLSYQWLFNEIAMPGETNATLSLTNVQAVNGGDYRVVVSNAFGLELSKLATLGGVNDNFTNRITIVGDSATVRGSNLGATSEPGEISTGWWENGQSVWWKWTAPATGRVIISTIGSDFNTVLGVFTGAAVSNLTLVAAADDDAGIGYDDMASFVANAGTEYQFRVAGSYYLNDSVGSVVLDLAFSTNWPTITGQPQNQTATEGYEAGFAVTVMGDAPFAYQWQFSGTNLAGATNASLLLTNLLLSQAGNYRVVVSNSFGSETSAVATLALIPHNDNFTNRYVLAGSSLVATGLNVNATKEAGEPGYYNYGRSVWWSWTAPATGRVVISTVGSSFNTMLRVFTGITVTNLTEVASDVSRVSFVATPGVEYQISVEGFLYSGPVGNIQLSLSVQDPVLGTPTQLANGQIQFQLSGPAGTNYVIQASTNLTNWLPIATNAIPDGGIMIFTDLFATNYGQRFYRAMAQ